MPYCSAESLAVKIGITSGQESIILEPYFNYCLPLSGVLDIRIIIIVFFEEIFPQRHYLVTLLLNKGGKLWSMVQV